MPTEPQNVEARARAANKAWQNMEIKNIALAARLHNAPPKREFNRVHGIMSKMERPGSKKKLNEQQEAMLLAYIDRMDELGVGALFHQVHNIAERILQLDAPEGTEPATLGRDWTKRFLKRHEATTHKSNRRL